MTAEVYNEMLPEVGCLVKIEDLGAEIKLFRVKPLNRGSREYLPGHFAFISAFGVGEAPFGVASAGTNGGTLDFAIQRLGSVTTRLHELGEGDLIGLRGPLGNCFPMHEFKEKNLVVLGGGVGGAPLRPVIQTVLRQRSDYGQLTILWAARHPSLLVFTGEYGEWRDAPDTKLHLTVDQPDSKWDHNVGLITELLERVAPEPENAVTITCGPPVMIHYVNQMLVEKLGFLPEQNYVTLEARMHCGLGKCGRCNLGEKLVCVDGPVFNMKEVGGMLESYL